MKGIRYIIGCLCVWLVACQQHEMIEPMNEPVSLTFKLDLANIGSRGLEAGDYLDEVSVYLVNANKQIVAKQENIDVPDNATEVEVKFEKSDNLKRGIHTLMAVANHKTLSSFNSGSYEALINNQVHATGNTDNISPKNVVQPLSLMKEIELHAGNNMVEGELIRTFARLRIEVKNNSGSMPLKINSLTFSDNFTQKQSYVFDDGTDRKYSFDSGAPVSTSTHALEPFVTDNNQSYKTIGAQTEAVVFDGYLLESKVAEGKEYTYTLDLMYDAASTVYRVVGEDLARVNLIKENYPKRYFLIKNQRSGKFIYNNNNRVYQGSNNLDDLNNQLMAGDGKNYLWSLEHANDNSFYIRNVNTGRYIVNPNSNNSAVGMNIDKGNPFVLSDYPNSDKGVMMKYATGNNYLNDYQNNFICGWNSSTDFGSSFTFYTVENNLRYDKSITLTTIDRNTQQSSPATAIKRNDFINVLITVSYNPLAGKFQFVVEDWNSGEGNVEFN